MDREQRRRQQTQVAQSLQGTAAVMLQPLFNLIPGLVHMHVNGNVQFVSEDANLLLRSETVTNVSDLGGLQFYDFATYILTLSPKDGPAEPGTVILGGVVPEPVKARKPEEAGEGT